MHTDLNAFIDDLDRRGWLRRVTEPVKPDLEMAAVIDLASKSPGGGPALLFERPTGFSMPVAANLFGSLDRMCLALGVASLDDLAKEIDRFMTPPKAAGIFDAMKLLPMVGRLSGPRDYVLATGEAHSVQDFVAEAFRCIGETPCAEFDERLLRPAEVDVLLGDYMRAAHLLQWTPRTYFRKLVRVMVTAELDGVEEGLDETWRYYEPTVLR